MTLALISLAGIVPLLIQIIVVGLVFGLLWWLISFIGLPEPFNKVVRVILAVAAVIFLISILLSVAGHPLIGP